jgi:plastocyanin
MARRHPHQRRLRRDVVVVAAVVVLASLCAPAALLAQDPVPAPVSPSVDDGAAPADPAAVPSPDSAPEPTPEEDPLQPDDPEPPADPGQAPAVDAPEPAPTAPLAVASGGATVTMADFSFSPATITVSPGDTVTWTNAGPNEPHTATGDGFDTGEVAVGSSGSATFSQAGTFSYLCTLHPEMTGTVEVVAAGADDQQGDDVGAAPAAPGSEAAAVAAPDAAGTASKLPSTGLVALPLAAIGIGLLALGTRLRHRASDFDK